MADDDTGRASSDRGVYALTYEERRSLALALLARTNRGEDGRRAFAAKYPTAPPEMIGTAAHHVYVDGPDAAVDFLAEAELALRQPSHEIGYGPTWELLYHVYNWLQFRALLPEGKKDILDLLAQLKQAVAEDDRAFITATATELEDVIEGHRGAPDFELP